MNDDMKSFLNNERATKIIKTLQTQKEKQKKN